MAKSTKSIALAEEAIISKIYLLQGKKVMLDYDLSEMYAVETKQLKRQVRRNIERFPADFMFELTVLEYDAFKEPNWHLKERGTQQVCADGFYRTGCSYVIQCIE